MLYVTLQLVEVLMLVVWLRLVCCILCVPLPHLLLTLCTWCVLHRSKPMMLSGRLGWLLPRKVNVASCFAMDWCAGIEVVVLLL